MLKQADASLNEGIQGRAAVLQDEGFCEDGLQEIGAPQREHGFELAGGRRCSVQPALGGAHGNPELPGNQLGTVAGVSLPQEDRGPRTDAARKLIIGHGLRSPALGYQLDAV